MAPCQLHTHTHTHTHTPIFLILALPMVVVLGTCGDSTTVPDDSLTRSEVERLLDGIEAVIGQVGREVASGASYPFTVACPLGGEAAASATEPDVRVVADTVFVSGAIVLDPDRCRVTGGGPTFTVDGAPNVQWEIATATVTSGEPEFLLVGASMIGGLDWRLEDRSGTCAIDWTFSLDEPSVYQTVVVEPTGTMCGHDVPPFNLPPL